MSDTPEKVAIPGQKQIWRLYDSRGRATADLVGMADESLADGDIRLHHPHRIGVSRVIASDEVTRVEELLVEVYRNGKRTSPSPDLDDMRSRRLADLDNLDVGVRRLVNPHIYHVSLTERMKELQLRLIAEAKGR